MSDDANSLLRDYEYLWTQQANWRSLWNEIAQFVMPAWDSFVGEQSEGTRRTYRLFDETAVSANERFASAMQQLIAPSTQQYQKLVPMDSEQREDKQITEYYEDVTKIIFNGRYRVKANFNSQWDECCLSLGAFGNFAMYVDEEVGVGVRYRSIPLTEMCWTTDHSGLVDTVYRKFKLTAKAAFQKWGKKCPESVLNALDKKPYEEFEFVHCVRPNMERKLGMPGTAGFKYSSWYVAFKERSIIDYRGYRSFPYGIGRYRMTPREHYGRSPASVALPAIRTLNEQKKSILRQGQMAVEPPLLLQEEGVLSPFSMRPGAMNYGMLNDDGTQKVQPFNFTGKIELGLELMKEEKQAINDSFLTTLFQILVDNPQMTATEALIRLQEKGMLIAPAGLRLQSEFLGSITEREMDIYAEAGQLPEPPPQLIEQGGQYKIDFLSPLNKAMRAEESNAIMQAAQKISVMASIQPSVTQIMDWDEAARTVCEIDGVPAKLLLSPEDLQAMREQQQQEQQMQQVVQAAPAVSQSVKNLAQAQQATQAPAAA